MEEEVFECGVGDARRAITAALESGCSAAEIRAVIAAWTKREDLGPGSLHYRIMELKPGDAPEKTWPRAPEAEQFKTRTDAAAERKRSERLESEATALIKSMHRRGIRDEAVIRAELAKYGLEWPK